MNRNDFLKKLGFGALAVAIAPRVLAGKDDIIYPRLNDGVTIDTDLLPVKVKHFNDINVIESTAKDHMTPAEVLDEYRRTGMVLFDKPKGWYSRTFQSYRDPLTGNTVFIDDKKV